MSDRKPARMTVRRHGLLVVALAALLVLAVLTSLAVGSRAIGLDEVIRALATDLDSPNATVITTQRLPRTLLGVWAGLALGVAGALMQGHTRNPLAEPGLFGVNAGASFAIGLVVFAFGVRSPAATVLAALLGAGVASLVVVAMGLRAARGGSVVMLAVVGTTLGALLTALTSALVLLDRQTLDTLRVWSVGSLANRQDALSPLVLSVVAVGLVLAAANAVSLNALSLGDEVAQALGKDVRRARLLGVAAITALAGSATAVCGPIGFVGLVGPFAARGMTGPDYRWLVPCAGLVGAVLVLTADTVGRVAGGQGELEAGIVAAALGAPVLIALTRRRRLAAL